MLVYTLKRLVYGAITVFFIATATFWAMHMVPGDPLQGEKAMTAEIRANLMKRYGLDKPAFPITLKPFGIHPDNQYFKFLANLAHGDLGVSFTQQNREVNDIIRDHFPISATLGVFALLLATLGGILFGSVAAIYRGKAPDRWTMFLVILGVSVPNFVFAAVGQYLLTEVNKKAGGEVLPVAGWGTFLHMLLPAVVLGLATMAFLTRLMRSSLLEIVNLDYIRTARAKGLPPVKIFVRHQLRNAVLPVITYLGPAIAVITTGGFVVETVFAIPGLGRYFVQAFQQLDYTVIMGVTVFYGSFLVGMVVLVDIIYGMVDPRISLAKG